MSNVDTLRNKRAHLRGTATRLENFLSQVTTDTSLFEIRARLEKVDKVYDSYQSLDIELSVYPESFPDREAELVDFESRFFRMKSKYTEIIDARLHTYNPIGDPLNSTTMQQDAMTLLLQSQATFLERLSALQSPPQSTTQATMSQTTSQSADVRLPKLNVPIFDGKYCEFKPFFDLFNSCIHANHSLSAVQKFQYLKGLLKDDPAALIRHLQVSEQNYEEALEKLRERYDKPSLVVDSLIDTFLNIPKSENVQSLRNVSNVADEVIRGLRSQGEDAEKRDPWLVHLLCEKIDRETFHAWAEHSGKIPFPSVDSFIVFINKRCDALERLPVPDIDRNSRSVSKNKSSRAYTNTMKRTCAACPQNHHLSYCPIFNNLDVPQRLEFVKEKLLCFNCLKPNHRMQNCPSKHRCETCRGQHHSLIHTSRKPLNTSTNLPSAQPEGLKSKPTTETKDAVVILDQAVQFNDSSINLSSSEVRHFNMLLPTARVLVRDNIGCFQSCNILLDSGCQNTLISEKCIQRLGLPRKPGKIYVCGLGNNKAGATKGVVELCVKSVHSNESIFMLAHIFTCLTSKLPCSQLRISYWDVVKDLPLADDKFDTPKDIDILVGFDYFFSLIRDGRIVKDDNLLAQNTAFGWVICSGCAIDESVSLCHVMNQTAPEDDLNLTLRLFWEVETLKPIQLTLNDEDQMAEDLYTSTTKKSERYSVRLPFRGKPNLGESFKAAIRRLMSFEKRFESNSELKKAYCDFMRDYISRGHMELVPEHKINRPVTELYYLPHHAVLKDSSLTTKLRVVFDGSSKSSNGMSLNDNLIKGPNLQQDLMAVLLRYRCKRFCFSADIQQMYRMIEVQECDRDFQRILWRENTSEKIQHYRLTTVTYGTTPAPYLAIRTLLELAEDKKDEFPLACESIKTCFYVDDCMSGCNTIQETQALVEQLNELLKAGGFRLRKWATNESQVLVKIPDIDKIESLVNIPTELTVCLLGVVWNPSTDCFSYKVTNCSYCIDTKRKMLSEISKIYDPLGWISPVIIAVKIIIQKLWLLNLNWDEKLPIDIVDMAKQLFSEFHLLNNVNIPRIIFSTENNVTYQGFCDASSGAYAAVVYCRKISMNGEISSNIVMSKTKVAPISMVSIPRLELCAAYLLTEILEYLIAVLSINKRDIVCWSDSKTVLAWLSSHPSKWKTYISHRTGYILETLPDVKWRYIPTKLNPADCASRGVRSSHLLDNKLWFQGPPFLLQDEKYWQTSKVHNFDTVEELRAEMKVNLGNSISEDVITTLNERISRWPKMIQVLAYCIRACSIFRHKLRNPLPIQVEEQRDAATRLFKYCQRLEFSYVIKNIQDGTPIASKKLKRLCPFLDDDGVLRVGGRLTKAELPYDSQHQIILHKDSPITRKIVQDCHIKNLHAGVTLLIATLRQRYWIIGVRELAKSVYHHCKVCHRYRAKANEQLMADLPKFRVNAAYPFYQVGCDYAGPIMYRQHNGRKAPIVKAYIAVFICLVTKAIHLELVSNLSSDAFLAALDRFVARRGLCGHIHSDNGTNFQGAAKKLSEIYKAVTNFNFNANISNFLSSKGIQWHFIPPGAPHFGGIWESTVKSMKFHLRRTIGEATLNYEELTTLLARIEAVLNSRPLVQADSDDIPYLSPGHFLIGRPLNSLPEADVRHLKTSTLNKWRLIQQLTQSFWSRWSSDYLLSLQPRARWLTEKPNLKVDDIVLLREENLPPACWKLGRVIEVHVGSDGLVRVATIKTENSTFRRPITKLVPLPKED